MTPLPSAITNDPSSAEPRLGHSPPAQRIRQLNVPLVVGTAAIVIVLAVVAWLWRDYQVRRTSETFLVRASAEEAEKNYQAAAGHLHRYLQLNPEDSAARIRLAETFDKSADQPQAKARAIELYYEALGIATDPHQPESIRRRESELRRRIAELLLEVRYYGGGPGASARLAEAEAKKLLDASPEDADGLRLLALARFRQYEAGSLAANREAEQGLARSLLEALARNPESVELSMALAHILRAEPKLVVYREDVDALLTKKNELFQATKKNPVEAAARAGLADRIVDRMIEENPKSVEAYLSRYQYRRHPNYRLSGAGDDIKAELVDDIKAALTHGPEDVRVLLTAAEHARQEPDTLEESSEEFCQRAKLVAPNSEPVYVALGTALAVKGDLDGAIHAWQEGIEKTDADSIDLNLRLAEALISRGRLDEVQQDPRAASEARPSKSPKQPPLDVVRRMLTKLGPQMHRAARLDLERRVDLTEARWLVAKGYAMEATTMLQRATAIKGSSADEESLRAFGYQLLGTAYRNLGQWDQAGHAYQEAATRQPRSVEARLLAGEAWMSAGQIERAIREYEKALSIEDRAVIRFLLAAAHFRRQAALPVSERNWQAFAEALLAAKARAAELPEPWRVNLLEAGYARSSQGGDPKVAASGADPLELLRETEKQYPDAASLMAMLVLTYQKMGQAADADRALKQFEAISRDPQRGCLLRASLLVQRNELDEARQVLQAGLAALPASAQVPLRALLVQVELTAGSTIQAKTQLEQLSKLNPSNLQWPLQLVELAFKANDLKEAERWEQVLLKREGPSGTVWKYCRSRRLLAQVAAEVAEQRRVDDPRFVEADRLRNDLLSQRPAWAAAHVLSGLVLELRGRERAADAVEAYGTAIRLGATDVNIYERIITLLYGLRRFDSADLYLSELRDRSSGEADQLLDWESRIAAGQATLAGDLVQRQAQFERAIRAAEANCQRKPEDAQAWLTLAQSRLAASLLEQDDRAAGLQSAAEKAFREAVRLAPADAAGYNGLFAFYVRTGQRNRAQETLQQLAEKAQIAPLQKALTLAEGYEIVGDVARAKAEYQKAEQADPDNLEVRERQAAFLIRTDRNEAERVLRAIRRSVPQNEFARVNLAQVLASRALNAEGASEQELWGEVEELLNQRRAEQSGSVLDRRLYAALLFRRGGRENLTRAREILQELSASRDDAQDLDHFLLAKIYDDEAKRAKAEGNAEQAAANLKSADAAFLKLVGRDKPQPAHLTAYLAFLLAHGRQQESDTWRKKAEAAAGDDPQQLAAYLELLLTYKLLSEADAPLKRLESLAPQNPATVSLRARWLHATGGDAEINPAIEALAKKLLAEAGKDPNREAAACATIGGLYTSVDQHTEAQRWYQRAVDLVPENFTSLALSLARQGQHAEALRLCRQAAEKSDSTRAAVVAAGVLAEGKPAAADFETADALLAEALTKHAGEPEVLTALANIRILQNRLEEAIPYYREAVKLTPKDVVLLNNLATLLSEQPAHLAEALQVIDRAIEIAGPQSYLLDTKGSILLQSGRTAEAITCLQTAISGPDPDPRYHFHLALAYDKAGSQEEARAALAAARDGKLADQILTEKDQQLLAELERRVLSP